MAIIINANDGFLLRVSGVAGDQSILNVWGLTALISVSDAGPWADQAAACAAINGEFRAQWRAYIIPYLCEEYTAFEYFVGKIDPAGPGFMNSWKFTAVSTLPGNDVGDVGGITGTSEPSFDAVSVQLKTGHPGKSGRGSKRLGPIPEGDTSFNSLTPGALAAWQSHVDNFCSALSVALNGLVGQWLVGVNSFKEWKALQPYSWPTTSRIVNTFVGSQKTRKSYLKGH